MRIVCISDTHEQHQKIKVPDGDLLIHAGDLTWNGEATAVVRFFDWFESLPHKYKVYIAGNHDFFFESLSRILDSLECKKKNIYYLQDSGCEIEGLKIWGSPYTPTFHDWAFMKDRGDALAEVWAKIPQDTDILITHGPPMGILDTVTPSGEKLGCWDLNQRVREISPKLHVFGHIHGGYGMHHVKDETIFVNASICDENYDPENQPIVVDL